MAEPIRILAVGGGTVDAAALARELDKMRQPYELLRASDERALLDPGAAFARRLPDVVLALDSDQPFDAVAIIAVVRERMPQVPAIVIAEAGGEDVAIETLKAGAADYVLTENLSRLAPAIGRALREATALEAKVESERALREAEARFRGLFEHAPVGITIRSHGQLLLANTAYLRMRGCESVSELPDTPLVDMLEPASRERYEQQMRQTGATSEAVLEGVAMRKDGSVFPFEMAAATVWLPDGEAYVSFFTDVSARRHAEAELDSYRRDLERMVRQRTDDLVAVNERLRNETDSKIRFLSSMSHELRIPLNSIIGFAGVLLQELPGPLNDEQRKQLRMVYDAAKRLTATIEEVLDVSRIEAGQTELHWEQFDAVAVMRAIADRNRGRAEEAGLQLRLKAPAGRIDMVSDRSIVSRIVGDLLENALKFTPVGAVDLRVLEEDGIVVMEVADTGIGIDEANLASVFEEFQQTAGVDGGRPAGAGLGLSICRKLATLLGGSLELASQPGEGTRVSLRVPRGPIVDLGGRHGF